MFSTQDYFQNLVHVGAILYLVCFLFRNQIALRIFAVAGDLAYTAYFYGVTDTPLWNAIFYACMNIAVNLVMIFLILKDHRQGNLGDNDLRLYRNLHGLTPGDFRRLTKIGTWETTDRAQILTEEGQSLERLYYVLDGELDIDKAGRKIAVKPGLFIGEVAFLKQTLASATVTAKPGTLLMSWTHAELRKLLEKSETLKQGLAGLLSSDMAEKVARS